MKYIESDGKYALVEGTFDARMTRHFGAYSGGIKNIKRVKNAA
jgi:hypothetical protein